MESLPTVLLKPGEADRIVAGHPWVYQSSILRMTAQAGDGELVQVKDHRQRLLGTGFFNSKSKIHVRVLAPERVEVNQNFFELGGHSLLLIQVHARLRKALNADLSVIDLFKYPTIETLARHLSPQPAEQPATSNHIQDRARLQQEAIRRQQELAKQRRQVNGSR